MTIREDTTWTAPDNGSRENEVAPEIEGVFLAQGGRARFVPVTIGIAGQEYFEVLSGLSEGDTVVAGPYQRIRQLHEGDPIQATEEEVVTEPGT
jgi:HlyD family secretion protein